MRAVGAPEDQTNEARGGRSSVEGTTDVIAASEMAGRRDVNRGT